MIFHVFVWFSFFCIYLPSQISIIVSKVVVLGYLKKFAMHQKYFSMINCRFA